MSLIKYPQLYNRQNLEKLIDDYGTDRAIARKIGCGKWTVRDAAAKLRLEERKENGEKKTEKEK